MSWLDAPLRTGRLELRAFEATDRPAILSLLTDPEVRRFLGGPFTIDDARAATERPVGVTWGRFAVVRDGEVIGSVSLERERRGELEISYELLPHTWGHGFATEAVGAVIDWAWSTTDDPAIIAVTQQANRASVKLLEELGFHHETTFEEFGAQQTQHRLPRPA